jgi:hypothetical protein
MPIFLRVDRLVYRKSAILSGGFFYRGLCLDDTRKAIIKLIESGHRASQVAQSLKISKSIIS